MLHKYSVKDLIITIVLELLLHHCSPLKCQISTPLISVSQNCVVDFHQMLCKACVTHWHTLITCAISPNLPIACGTLLLQVLLRQNTPCFLCAVIRCSASLLHSQLMRLLQTQARVLLGPNGRKPNPSRLSEFVEHHLLWQYLPKLHLICVAGVLVAHAMELFADDEATILSPRGFYV